MRHERQGPLLAYSVEKGLLPRRGCADSLRGAGTKPMMGERQVAQGALFYEFSIERHVPVDHMLRAIDRFVDLSELRAHLASFYSPIARPSVDPELLIRMLIVGYCFGIRSERRLCEEVHLNLGYRWFCRLGLRGRRAGPLHLLQEPARPLPRERSASPAVRAGAPPVHRRGLGGRRGLRRGRQPDQGRCEPSDVRARLRRAAA